MSLYDFIQINKEPHLWDAIKEWRDWISNSNTWRSSKSCYLLNMHKLIDAGVIDVRHPLNEVNEQWLIDAKQKVDKLTQWSSETKSVRKSCINSLYKFIQKGLDPTLIPYQRHPRPEEIKHVLSGCIEKALTIDISPEALFNEVSKINERDAYIVWLMMHTGQRLEAVLSLKKESLRIVPPAKGHMPMAYIDFENTTEEIHPRIVKRLKEFQDTSETYLFETDRKKRITRAQLSRNLKRAGERMGLSYELTPKLLHGCVIAYMSDDKRDELQKMFNISIN